MNVELGVGIYLVALSFGGWGYSYRHNDEVPFAATMCSFAAFILILHGSGIYK